ncbi:hypothetical protein, partial [Phytobacter massiliensis]|uniref:hypothetical protein n=1 Tax=Phytobacter massiliensis TaxID=1485952 RepID=UPI001CA32914
WFFSAILLIFHPPPLSPFGHHYVLPVVMGRNGHCLIFLHRNPQTNKLINPETNKRHSAKQSNFTFFISLFISFQSRSLSAATLWITKNVFACSGLTAARSE